MNQNTALATITALVDEVRPRFDAVSVDRSVSFEREASFAVQALMANNYALQIGLSNPQSVQNAVANVSAIGLTLNPAKRQAYLVPREGRICLDIGYIGLLDMAVEAGGIVWAQAELVYASDVFTLRGIDQQPVHERQPFAKDRGDVVGAYVVAKTPEGDYLTTCMDTAELESIRDRTAAWKAGKSTPWKTDPGEMMKKTVIKRAAKTWPHTPASAKLDRAIQYLNTDGDEGLPAIESDDPLDQPRNFGLTPARAVVVRNAAKEALQKFNEGDEFGAYGEACAITDTDEKLALWSILKPHSALRSCIKRLAAEERAAEDKLKQQRQEETQ